MKKLLTLVAVVAVAGAVSSASAMDRSGKFGLGYQATAFSNSSANGDWSLKYGFSPNLTGQFMIGFGFGNKGFNNNVNFGARILYDLVEKENSDFYTGLGIMYNVDSDSSTIAGSVGGDGSVLGFSIPLGFEWSFASLPELGFSAEAGFIMNYWMESKQFNVGSVGETVGGSLGLGVHYYF